LIHFYFVYKFSKQSLQIQEKALELATLLQVSNFVASSGWLESFQHRHSISLKIEHGEAGGVDINALTNWQEEVLQHELKNYGPDDIFNVDETGLFWRMLPSKTLAFKGEKCSSGKKSKERITVLIGSNMSGSEKVPLLVIGKSQYPRAFKNAKITIDYRANTKAWMTAAIFEDFLKKWDRRLGSRKILLFVDNCTAHPHLQLKNIKLKFFLPNTTSKAQPMDQGVIANLKCHYRKLLLRRQIQAFDANVPFSINLLDAVNMLRRAWDCVKEETLHNCFRKAKFIQSDEV
jgi:hypothetical protein